MEDINISNNVVKQVSALAISANAKETTIPYAVIPEGYEIASLEEFVIDENQIKQTVQVNSVSSFIAYISRFKNDRSVIFANVDKTVFQGSLDYHLDPATPDKLTHTVYYSCPKSKEWLAFTNANKTAMDQLEFAVFIEQNINCIAPVSDDYPGPSGSELLEMVLAFEETRKSEFKAVQRLSDGTFQVSYSDEKQGSKNTQIPQKISLALSPFHNGKVYQVDARIRYRLRDGSLKLWYELIDPEKVVEDAFNTIMVDLEAQLPDVPVYEGSI